MAALSLPAALLLRLGWSVSEPYFEVLTYGIPLFVVIAAVTFRAAGMYRGIWRYASTMDLVAIAKGASLAILLFLPLMFAVNRLETVPRSVPVIQWLLLMVMLGGPRFLYRLYRDGWLPTWQGTFLSERIPVLLIGTGDPAALFVRAVNHNRQAPYRVVGLIDPKGGRRTGRDIYGVPVLGRVGDLEQVIETLALVDRRPRRLILSEPTARTDPGMLRHLMSISEKEGLTLAQLPSLTEFKTALDDSRLQLRPIAIEDLLSRSQTPIDYLAIRDLVRGRRVLVTGAGGTIGSELVRQLAGFGPSCITLVDNGEYSLYEIDQSLGELAPSVARHAVLADVRDRRRLLEVAQDAQPELIFHAAALKHVPLVEANPAEGIRTNALGTRHVAEVAMAVGAQAMVTISTDKAVNPSSVMGASKRLSEFYCQALDLADGPCSGGRAQETMETRFLTVRFGNVLGSSGSVVPLFKRQLARGGPLTVTHPEMRRYFMTVREAVGLVLQATVHGLSHPDERGRIFVLDMGEPIRIVDIAHQMMRLAGLEPDKDVKLVFTGLRPGEKLHEDLFDVGERPLPTSAQGILAAVPQPIELGMLQRAFDELASCCASGNAEELKLLISRLVPGFSYADAGAPAGRAETDRNRELSLVRPLDTRR